MVWGIVKEFVNLNERVIKNVSRMKRLGWEIEWHNSWTGMVIETHPKRRNGRPKMYPVRLDDSLLVNRLITTMITKPVV
jgi:hypothetical protein